MKTNTKTLASLLILSLIGCTPQRVEIPTTSTTSNIPTTSEGSSTTSSESSCNLDPQSPQNCDKGLVCIGLKVTDEGICVTPCLDSCSEGTCQDWTATSKPQLPSGVGVCK